jgi:hypothetical protein
MKRTLITAVALAACAATPLFAQNVKEGVMSFGLTFTKQRSVSTSLKDNEGRWSQVPLHYRTKSQQVNEKFLLQAIGAVLHPSGGANSSSPNSYYLHTLKPAQLVLVQSELGGFFNLVDSLVDVATNASVLPLPGGINFDTFGITSYDSTTLGGGTFAALATGRHYEPVPAGFATEGAWPPGHHQPWGQVYVKDPQRQTCENVTFFFEFKVTECYDCFYLSSFVSDSDFKYKAAATVGSGPPCCGGTVPSDLSGKGVDQYYLTMTFDNTWNNPYLQTNNAAYVGYGTLISNPYAGIEGLRPNNPEIFPDLLNLAGGVPTPASYVNPKYLGLGYTYLASLDGLTPDFFTYTNVLPRTDLILSRIGHDSPNEARITLAGIVTYRWELKLINVGDVIRDFVGTATYDAYGNGMIGLFCGLFKGRVSVAERIVNTSKNFCCTDLPWYEWWYGIGWDSPTGLAGNSAARTANESPVNVPVDLTFHAYQDEDYISSFNWPLTGVYPPYYPTGFPY